MSKIVRDKKYYNTIWCQCNDYEEFLQFAKDLFQLKGLETDKGYDENARWVNDGMIYSELFGIDIIEGEDEEGCYYEESVNPINDIYEMKKKPKENEYPVIVNYDNYLKQVIWVSLNELQGAVKFDDQ